MYLHVTNEGRLLLKGLGTAALYIGTIVLIGGTVVWGSKTAGPILKKWAEQPPRPEAKTAPIAAPAPVVSYKAPNPLAVQQQPVQPVNPLARPQSEYPWWTSPPREAFVQPQTSTSRQQRYDSDRERAATERERVARERAAQFENRRAEERQRDAQRDARSHAERKPAERSPSRSGANKTKEQRPEGERRQENQTPERPKRDSRAGKRS